MQKTQNMQRTLLLVLLSASLSSAACNAPTPTGTLTAPAGQILSDADGSGPIEYVNNEDCTWVIDCPGDSNVIEITFTGFTESTWDFVTTLDPLGAQLRRVSGDVGGTFSLPYDKITVTFTSDVIIPKAGFTADYVCGSPTNTPSATTTTSLSNSLVPTPTPTTTPTSTISPTLTFSGTVSKSHSPSTSGSSTPSTTTSRTGTGSLPSTATSTLTRSHTATSSMQPTSSNSESLTATTSHSRSDSKTPSLPPTLTASPSESSSRSSTTSPPQTATILPTPTATIAPPILFNASLGFDGAAFTGAASAPLTVLLTLTFSSTNHRDAAVARHNVSVVCQNATVDAGVAWTTPVDSSASLTGGSSAVLRRASTVTLSDSFRGISDTCRLVVCAPFLRSCASATGMLPVQYPELNVSSTFNGTTSVLTARAEITGKVPAENTTLTVGVRGLVGLRLAWIANSSSTAAISCVESNPVWTCSLGRLDPAIVGNTTVELQFILAAPAFYVGEVSMLVAARPSNTDAVFASRLVYDLAAARTVEHEAGIVNASGLAFFFDVVEKTLNLTSQPLPPGARPLLTPAPLGFMAHTGASLENSSFGLHFVLLTTLVFACVIVAGQVVARIRRHDPVPTLGETPTWRIVAAHHLWAGVVLPCTVRCAAIHGTTLYVGVLACYATAAGVVAATPGWGNGSRVALAAIAGAVSMSIPRVLSSVPFHSYQVPNAVEVASRRSSMKQLRSRRETKFEGMQIVHRSKSFKMSEDSGVDALSFNDFPLDPVFARHMEFDTTLQPLAMMDDDAINEGDAADVAMELPDAVFPTMGGNVNFAEQSFADLEGFGFDDADEGAISNSGSFVDAPSMKVLNTATNSADMMGPSSTAAGLSAYGESGDAMPLIAVVNTEEDGVLVLNDPATTTNALRPGLAVSLHGESAASRDKQTANNSGTNDDAIPLILVNDDGEEDEEAGALTPEDHAVSLPLPLGQADGGSSVSSAPFDWQLDHLSASQAQGNAVSPAGTIARLDQSFGVGVTARTASPLPSVSSNVSAQELSLSFNGPSGEFETLPNSPTVPMMNDDHEPIVLHLSYYRRAGYAVCGVLALILGLVTVSLSGRWVATPNEGTLFWTAVPVACCLHATVVEALALALCVLRRWVVEDVPPPDNESDETTASGVKSHLVALVRRRHPYERESVESAIDSRKHQGASM